MNAKVLDQLNINKIENDVALLYWIYNVEIVNVSNRRFCKIYLFNRENNKKALNSITFNCGGREYTVNSFDVVSAFNNAGIIGCYFELENDTISSPLVIVSEKIDNTIINSSGIKYIYQKSEFPKEDSYLREKFPSYSKNHLVFPFVNDGIWQCSCGRINEISNKECTCGQKQEQILSIINFNYEENRLNDYIASGINYDLTKSFEDNINIFKENYNKKYGYDADKLDAHIDAELEKNKYDRLVNEKIQLEKKKKKKRNIIISIVILIVIAIGSLFIFAPDYAKYAKCTFTSNLREKVICFSETPVLDSEKKANEAFKKYITQLYDSNDYEKVIDEYGYLDKYVTTYSMLGVDYKFGDSELKEMFLDAYYPKIKADKYNLNRLNYHKTILSKIDSRYNKEIDGYIYDIYEDQITEGKYTTAQFFYDRYKTSKSNTDYKNMLKSAHYYISKSKKSNKDTLRADSTELSSFGFKRPIDFYEELNDYGMSSSILNDQCYDTIKLVGYWSGGNYHFKMEEDGHITYNVPWFDYGDYYNLYDHVIYVYPEGKEYDSRDLFKFTWVSDTTVKVYSYKNGLTYTLYKQY